MFSSFFKSKKYAFFAYSGLIFIILVQIFEVDLMVQYNKWNRSFYDLAQDAKNHTIEDFWNQMFIFLWIAIPLVLVGVLERYVVRLWVFQWREAITFSYFKYWKNVEHDVEGSSQRIQEDALRFARILEDIGSRVLSAILTLIAFIPVLWELSAKVKIPFLNETPGSLVWIALGVSIGGLIISWLVGWYLPRLEYDNQKVEAAFRKELVLAEDDKINYGGQEQVGGLFAKLKHNYYKLYLHLCYFDLWLRSFSQILILVPYFLVGPGIFTQAITLGVLVQVSNAFNQVRGSFSIFMNNWTTITELRSIHMRLKEFEKNIDYKG